MKKWLFPTVVTFGIFFGITIWAWDSSWGWLLKRAEPKATIEEKGPQARLPEELRQKEPKRIKHLKIGESGYVDSKAMVATADESLWLCELFLVESSPDGWKNYLKVTKRKGGFEVVLFGWGQWTASGERGLFLEPVIEFRKANEGDF